jgi:hypothetical protein
VQTPMTVDDSLAKKDLFGRQGYDIGLTGLEI